MTKKQIDIGLASTVLRFIRNHRRNPQAIRVAPNILDTLYTKEELLNTQEFYFCGITVYVDNTMKPGTVEAIWLN